jgi:ABC-2 type transport system permease protein
MRQIPTTLAPSRPGCRSDPGGARAVLGTAAYLAGIGLIGLALGTLIRGTAGTIGLLPGAVLILPSLATALLPDS